MNIPFIVNCRCWFARVAFETLTILSSQHAAVQSAGAARNVKHVGFCECLRQPWNPSSLKIHPLHTTLRVCHSECLWRLVANIDQGEGQCNQEWGSTKTTNEPTPQAEATSYAPQGLPNRHQKLRKRPSHILTLETPLAKGAVARFHNTCSVRHRGPIIRPILALTVSAYRLLFTAGLAGPRMHSSLNNSDTS